ncbi:MAG TPA: response regulator [Anaerolineae bacterium]|nr:response regulator [Anaerolineae bacterium]HMR65401.1 response regulator [Anaerolineae bacterium]
MDKRPVGESFIILLVEDEPAHARLVIRSFEEHRISNRIVHVSDGEAALDYLFQRGLYANPEDSPRPHLILLDLHLPRIDGLEVLSEIKQDVKLKQIPVVMLTTSRVERDRMGAYERYVNSYLVKPLEFDQFIKLMDDLGFYWLGWNFHS